MRFYNTVLAHEQIRGLRAKKTIAEKAAARWDLREVDVDTVPDKTTHGHDAKIVGSRRTSKPGRATGLTLAGFAGDTTGFEWVAGAAGLRLKIPAGDGPLMHHIGLYAFRTVALAQFVALPECPLEQRERLEQLRALAAGMRIDVALVDTVPDGVDTPADLEKARSRLAHKS